MEQRGEPGKRTHKKNNIGQRNATYRQQRLLEGQKQYKDATVYMYLNKNVLMISNTEIYLHKTENHGRK